MRQSREIPAHVPAYGLSPMEERVLVLCYHDGRTQQEVADWYGITQQMVELHIQSATEKLVKLGLPAPRPYGQGSRAELRRLLPAAVPSRRTI